MSQLQKVRITESRIIEFYCLDFLKGTENFVRISKSSNYASSNKTELTAVKPLAFSY